MLCHLLPCEQQEIMPLKIMFLLSLSHSQKSAGGTEQSPQSGNTYIKPKQFPMYSIVSPHAHTLDHSFKQEHKSWLQAREVTISPNILCLQLSVIIRCGVMWALQKYTTL